MATFTCKRCREQFESKWYPSCLEYRAIPETKSAMAVFLCPTCADSFRLWLKTGAPEYTREEE